MNTNNIAQAKKYYQNMLLKSFDEMKSCLHPDVHLLSPLSEVHGRDNVVEAAMNLSNVLQDIIFKAEFSNDSQVMFSYDFMFTGPIGKLKAAVLLNFTDGLISRIDLFYDGRPFVQKKDEIFTNN